MGLGPFRRGPAKARGVRPAGAGALAGRAFRRTREGVPRTGPPCEGFPRGAGKKKGPLGGGLLGEPGAAQSSDSE